MATLARSLENLESSSQSCGVVGVPGDFRGPVTVTVVHAHRVDLLFVSLNTVRGTDVISEEPGLRSLRSLGHGVEGTAGQQG
jgi:hypothetical protein